MIRTDVELLNETYFHEIISGSRRGLGPALWRGMFRVAEVPYGLAVRQRNRRYNSGRLAVHKVGIPVISVGNITTGGTGKTPMVEWLARWFREREVRVVLISRGYGAEKGSLNDEALELEQKLPDVPHLQNPNRVEAAQVAIEEFESQLILLDDGFQHRRIHRDLDIVLVDALEPFGYGHLLPRGLLREPLSGLRRADVVALTRSDMVDVDRRAEIRGQVERHNANATWIEVSHKPRWLLSSTAETISLDWLRGQRIAAFCGIGNPAGFRHTLEACGCDVADLKVFPDHHRYGREDIDQLADWARSASDISTVVCTHKDLVKIAVERIGPHPLWALSVGMEILSGHDALESHLSSLASFI